MSPPPESNGTPLPAELQGKLLDADTASLGRLETAMYELMTGAADRAKNAVDVVQKSSAAILAIYTAILGLVFSASGTPLPLRGIVAPLFLGLAVVLSTSYLASAGAGRQTSSTLQLGDGQETRVVAQLAFYARYVNLIVGRRLWALRASVMALGVGLVSVSFPFLDSAGFIASGWFTLAAAVVGALAVGLAAIPWGRLGAKKPDHGAGGVPDVILIQ